MKPYLSFICLSVLICSCSGEKKPTRVKKQNPHFEKATEFRDQGVRDSAFLYYNQAKDLYLQQSDSVAAGVSLVNMALIATDSGDLFGGQELSVEAASYFDESNPQHHPYLLSLYNNLGIASSEMGQYARAVEYYEKSMRFMSDSLRYPVVKNNIANAHRRNGDLRKAIAIYESVLPLEKEPRNYARILSSLAYSKWLQQPSYNPEPALRRALSIRIKEGDLFGQNATYAHLADYYMSRSADSALHFSKSMYRTALSLKSADDQAEALQKLIPLSAPADARRYFSRYRVLNDSIRNARNNARNQFALIRYETEKHKAENLALEQENTVRTIGIISLLVLLIAGSIGTYFWYSRRKKHLEREARDAIRDAQLKTSKKVHDVVANGLYRLMSEMENNKEADQEKILDDMELLYERSRDISYDDTTAAVSNRDFPESIRRLLMSFSSASTRVVIAGNSAAVWEPLSAQTRTELQMVLQELMINMAKHSQASSVAVRFEQLSDTIGLYYTDNGIGMDGAEFKNGLTSTGNRINSIGGTITFGTGTAGGLNVQIRIPVLR